MLLKFFWVLIVLLISVVANAQHPFSTKWYSVNTPHVKIIADKSVNQKDIFRIANSFETVFACDTVSLKDNPRKIPLVISNQSTTSNGFATLFPYKMYWYGMPFQNNSLGTGEWFQNLAVHEYRHVIQYQVLNHGLTKCSSILFGAYGHSIMRISVPNWWFEGDAVYAETILTTAGRGRVSSFDLLTASILDSRPKNFPYDKMVNGSFRNYLPNHYELGYHLVTHGRIIAGADVWTKTARRSSWYSFWPWSFGSSFRHFSGINLTKNYRQTMNDLRNFYSQRIDSLNISEAKIITQKHPRRYTSYSNPRFINSNTIVALKSSLTEPNKVVTVNLNGEENDLFCTEITSFDYADNKLIWATNVPDMRWSLRGYSDIAIYDFKTQKRYRVTNKGRYFSPAISTDGKYVAAVEFDQSRNASLVIFKTEYIGEKLSSLHIIKKIPAQYGEYLRSVRFVNDNDVALVSNFNNKNAIVVYDLVSSQRRIVKDYQSEAINTLKPSGDNIFYDSDFSGITNIWMLNTKNGVCNLVTSRKYSASQPDISPDGHTFIYSDFLSTGANIVSATLNTGYEVSMDNVKPCKLEYFKPLVDSEPYQKLDFVASASSSDDKRFKVKDYKQFYDPIRIYGWMPYADEEGLGGTVFSENTLGTLQLSADFSYKPDAEFWQTTLSGIYSGFYPVLGVSAIFHTDADEYYFRDRYGEIYSQYLYWDSRIANFAVSVPFNFSRFNWRQSVNLSSQFSRYQISDKPTESYADLGNGNINVFYVGFSYSLSRDKAYRDYRSPLSFSVKADASKTNNYHRKAQKINVLANITVPGLFRQNSLSIDAGFMRQVKDYNHNNIYLFADPDFDIRGYSSVRFHECAKISGEYSFPLGYPDFGIPAIVWCKRVRGSIIADAAAPLIFGYRYNFASAGFKLVFDVNFIRLSNNVSIGCMYAKPLINNVYSKTQFGLLLSYQM